MKEKIIVYAREFRIYPSKSEILLRLIVWGLSWVFGILSLFIKGQIKDSGYSFFIFTLTVLLEFAPQIYNKQRLFGRVIHVLFWMSMIILLFISAVSIFSQFENKSWYYWMLRLSVLPLLYIIIGFFVLWLDGGSEEKPLLEFNQELINKYVLNSKQGALGNVNKEEQDHV